MCGGELIIEELGIELHLIIFCGSEEEKSAKHLLTGNIPSNRLP